MIRIGDYVYVECERGEVERTAFAQCEEPYMDYILLDVEGMRVRVRGDLASVIIVNGVPL